MAEAVVMRWRIEMAALAACRTGIFGRTLECSSAAGRYCRRRRHGDAVLETVGIDLPQSASWAA